MAVGVMSPIVSPYKRDDTIDAAATVKNGEAVFTHGSPRSSAPGTNRGTPAAIGSAVPEVHACAQPCHSADVYVQEAVLKWLKGL